MILTIDTCTAAVYVPLPFLLFCYLSTTLYRYLAQAGDLRNVVLSCVIPQVNLEAIRGTLFKLTLNILLVFLAAITIVGGRDYKILVMFIVVGKR